MPRAQVAELTKLALVDAASLGTTISTDSTVKREGKGTVWVDDVHLLKEALK